MSIPWRFTTDFDDQQHLFYEKIETGYLLEAFTCSCGHTDFAIKHPKQNIKYVCPECENSDFYDANTAWQNIGHFLSKNENVTFSFDYDVRNDKDRVVLSYVTLIPKRIDFLRNRVIYEKKSIYSIEVTVDGVIKKDYALKYNDEVFIQLEKKIVRYFSRYNLFNIPYPRDSVRSLKKIKFFLKHKHLKDIDFYRWKDVEKIHDDLVDVNINSALEMVSNYRKEKSVRRAVYSNYIRQIKNEYIYDPRHIDVYTRTIEDPNILVKFLGLNIGSISEELQATLIFFKQHYTEKQILKLFASAEHSNENFYLLRNALEMFFYDEESIRSDFRKIKCNTRSIHDEFSRCINAREYAEKYYYEFAYTKLDYKACVDLSHDYSVRLPKSNHELYEWGEHMHNCIAGYEPRIKLNKTIIYGFFNGDSLKFVAEVYDKSIIEASGKYNAILKRQENSVLQMWFRRFFTETQQGENECRQT